MERIGSTGVVASRSFQNILSVLYKDGLGRFRENCGRNCCERIIEGTQDAKSGELPEDLLRLLREVFRKYPDIFKDVPGPGDS